MYSIRVQLVDVRILFDAGSVEDSRETRLA